MLAASFFTAPPEEARPAAEVGREEKTAAHSPRSGGFPPGRETAGAGITGMQRVCASTGRRRHRPSRGGIISPARV
jgi:hypothetical protein